MVFPVSILVVSEIMEMCLRRFFLHDKLEEEAEDGVGSRDGLANYVVDPEETSYSAADQMLTQTSYSRRRHAKDKNKGDLHRRKTKQEHTEKTMPSLKTKKKKQKKKHIDNSLFDPVFDNKKDT